MNAQAILDKIGLDAQETAQRIADEAMVKCDQLKAASRAKIEAMQAATLAQAQRDGDELALRLTRMAELDDRKALLEKKRALIDTAFARATELMAAMPVADKRAFFLGQIARFAMGGEVLAVSENAAWFDAAFLTDANRALAEAGKPAGLTLAGDRPGGSEGITLRAGGAEVRFTAGVMLDEARAAMEQQVAAELFAQ